MQYNVSAAYISASADDPQACYDFISRMAQRPELFDQMPARESVIGTPELAATQGEDVVNFYRAFAQQLQRAFAVAALFVLVTVALGLGLWLGHPVWGFGIVAAVLIVIAAIVGVAMPEQKLVSLEPPLVCFNVGHDAQTHGLITRASRFAVHVLPKEQSHLYTHFALPDLGEEEQFAELAYTTDAHGTPILDEALAVFVCGRHATFEAGDHTIIVGRVLQIRQGEGRPVVYMDRSYREVGGEVKSSRLSPVKRGSSVTS